jgi:hypothetical protein
MQNAKNKAWAGYAASLGAFQQFALVGNGVGRAWVVAGSPQTYLRNQKAKKDVHCELHGRRRNRPQLCRISCRRFSAWNHRSGEDMGTSTNFFSKM